MKQPEPNNLEQIIKECGMGFRSLSLHTDGRWIAKSGRKATPTNKLFTSKNSPTEAVYKMLLEINANK